jgi:outer membrane biosynthesis protein TonB
VKKTEKHISKFFRDPLPEPEVPADDAWAGMSDMLGAAAGGTPVNGDAGQWFSGLVKIKGLILTSLSLVSVTAVVIYQLSDSPASTSKPAPALTQSEQTENRNEPVQKAVTGKTEQIKENNTIPNNPEQKEQSNTIPNNPEQQEQNNTLPNNPKQKEQSNTIPNNPEQQEQNNTIPNNPEQKEQNKTIPNNPEQKEQNSTIPNTPEQDKTTPTTLRKSEATRLKANAETLITQSEKTDNNGSIVKNAKTNRRSSNDSGLVKTRNEDQAINEAVGSSRDLQSLKTAPTLNLEKPFNVRSLKPLNVHFRAINTDLGRRVVIQNLAKQPEIKTSETNRSFHLGLEWALNSSLKSTAYIATGADSIPRVARLLIPGIFATKNWSKSSITVSFLPYQSYFGENKLVRQIADSLNSDSIKTYSNALFIKAVGINFSAQYQYHVTRFFALNAGASYIIFTSALFRPQTQNWQGKLLDGQLTTLKKSTEISPYVNPYLFTLKAGIALTPGRFQAGLNVILPLSNISKSSQFPVKTLNGHVYLRYLVW